jgi:hypothetical protein
MASVPVPKAAARTGRPSMLRGIDTYRVAFTGSGAEYFRVWVVNIVLSVVTLSLYTPWARRRTAQYFYGHTQIAGSPLEFVAELRQSGGDKGSALRRFMAEPPFAGRRPVAFGDDLNDMPMLAAARELGGLAVAMGERDLPADHRLSGPRALAEWLERGLA